MFHSKSDSDDPGLLLMRWIEAGYLAICPFIFTMVILLSDKYIVQYFTHFNSEQSSHLK
jgi:hypothetical protein